MRSNVSRFTSTRAAATASRCVTSFSPDVHHPRAALIVKMCKIRHVSLRSRSCSGPPRSGARGQAGACCAGFSRDGAQELRAHRLVVQPPDGELLPAVQTGLQLAIRRQAEAVAARAELAAHGPDQANATLCARQDIPLATPPSGGRAVSSGQRVQHRRRSPADTRPRRCPIGIHSMKRTSTDMLL